MTASDFRRLALELPEATEGSHMGHPDFRVGGKIFATLGHPNETLGMVKLSPEQQFDFVQVWPLVFEPVPGGWGRGGATHVRLSKASKTAVRKALMAAWRNRAPKKLSAKWGEAHNEPDSQR